jgi:hypothetical protein
VKKATEWTFNEQKQHSARLLPSVRPIGLQQTCQTAKSVGIFAQIRMKKPLLFCEESISRSNGAVSPRSPSGSD